MIPIVLNLQMLNKFSATRDRLSELAAAALIAVPAAKKRWIHGLRTKLENTKKREVESVQIRFKFQNRIRLVGGP